MVLELAAGTSDTGFEAAALVSERGGWGFGKLLDQLLEELAVEGLQVVEVNTFDRSEGRFKQAESRAPQ
jgi:hypothetical protein